MAEKKCQAFVESTGVRCQKRVRWGKKYCWWHYPKGGMILGALIALALTLLFMEPLRQLLSPLSLFHYLDTNAPTVTALSPDVRALKYIDPNTHTFTLTCHDDCSRVDWAACEVDVFRLKSDAPERLRGGTTIETNTMAFALDEELSHGEYFLSMVICDKAANQTQAKYYFIVPENDIIDIKVTCEEYENDRHRVLFRSFLDEFEEQLNLDQGSLWVYKYIFTNKSQRTYCRSLSFSIDNQESIFCWNEIGGMDYRGVSGMNVAEAMVRRLPLNMVFTSQRLLSIDEIGPGGQVCFASLVGYPSFVNRAEKRHPEDVGVHGTYSCEGYGRTTVTRIGRWIPAKQIESEN